MAVGGGTVAFVGLWRGIVFCDVLAALDEDTIPKLHYVKLLRPLWNQTLKGEPRLYRDIAVIGNRIKYVELVVRYYKYKACRLCEPVHQERLDGRDMKQADKQLFLRGGLARRQ
jgi:hypothetical protein